MEEPLGLQGLQVEAVEERELAFWRSARSDEEYGIAVLPDHSLSIGKAAHHGSAGITVAVADRALPDQFGRLSRLAGIHHKGTHPAAAAVKVTHQAEAFFTPGRAREPLLHLQHLRWL